MVPSLTSRFELPRYAAALTTVTAAVALLVAAAVSPARAQRVLTVIAHDTSLESSQRSRRASRRSDLLSRERRNASWSFTACRPARRPRSWRAERRDGRSNGFTSGASVVRRCHATRCRCVRDTRPPAGPICARGLRGRPQRQAARRQVRLARGFRDRRVCTDCRALPGARPDNAHQGGQIEVSGVVRTGQRMVQVENTGGRPHDVLIGRLKPGKTLDDVRRWDRDRDETLAVRLCGRADANVDRVHRRRPRGAADRDACRALHDTPRRGASTTIIGAACWQCSK